MTEPAIQDSTSGEFLQVLGVDVLCDRSLRRYHLLRLSAEEREATTREFLLLLVDPYATLDADYLWLGLRRLPEPIPSLPISLTNLLRQLFTLLRKKFQS